MAKIKVEELNKTNLCYPDTFLKATIIWGWLGRLLHWRKQSVYVSEGGIIWYHHDTKMEINVFISLWLEKKIYQPKKIAQRQREMK